jgi:hypothetical protein
LEEGKGSTILTFYGLPSLESYNKIFVEISIFVLFIVVFNGKIDSTPLNNPIAMLMIYICNSIDPTLFLPNFKKKKLVSLIILSS